MNKPHWRRCRNFCQLTWQTAASCSKRFGRLEQRLASLKEKPNGVLRRSEGFSILRLVRPPRQRRASRGNVAALALPRRGISLRVEASRARIEEPLHQPAVKREADRAGNAFGKKRTWPHEEKGQHHRDGRANSPS